MLRNTSGAVNERRFQGNDRKGGSGKGRAEEVGRGLRSRPEDRLAAAKALAAVRKTALEVRTFTRPDGSKAECYRTSRGTWADLQCKGEMDERPFQTENNGPTPSRP